MKWFKHDSDAGNDAKLRKLRIKYGAQGYGIYWYCLELIARNVEKHNLTFELEHDAELIADDFKLSGELVQEMMIYMVNLGLFENTQGVITCLKMSTRTDEYTQQLIRDMKKSPEKLPRVSGETPRNSEVKEEKRREENNTKGSRLSLEWQITDEFYEEAHKINPSLSKNRIKEISEEFKDHWIAVSGNKGVKNDWLATWRNWIRRQKEFSPNNNNNTPNRYGVVL